MKVIRLKRGYSIRMNDSEFGMLQSLVSEGEGGICAEGTWQTQGIPAREGLAYDRRTAEGLFLRIDEDRRKGKERT